MDAYEAIVTRRSTRRFREECPDREVIDMMIAANAFDLGSCWINQLHWLDESPAIRKVLEGCGLSDDETITGGLVLGYAEQGLPVREKLERHGNPVSWN